MTALVILGGFAIAIVCGAAGMRWGWELGFREGCRREKGWALARWRRTLEILQQIEPDAYEAVEVAAYMLGEEDQDRAELEKIGRL